MEKYFVNASWLNVRSLPALDPANIIARLQQFRVVDILNKSRPDWWEIQFFNGKDFTRGYVAARYLTFLSEEAVVANSVVPANFLPDPRSNLNSKGYLFKPIGDSTILKRDILSTSESKKQALRSLIDKLNVSGSFRYKRTEKNTFCNIYAYDYCYFCDVYLPRVWWNSKSIQQLSSGQEVDIVYAQTVFELNANSLHNWLVEWGDDFNWQRVNDVDTLQNLVNNNGGVGLICAKRKDLSRSGHIVAVVPETDQHTATRSNGKVIYPLQSQAGAYNFNYFSQEKKDWWTGSQFSSFVFFFHE